MKKTTTKSLLNYLLLIYCLHRTSVIGKERKMIDVPLGTTCNTTEFLVDLDSIYNIATPFNSTDVDLEFVDCEITFTPTREDGRLCIRQDGPEIAVRDANVEFNVKENTESVFTVLYYPSRWHLIEHCTQPSSSLSLSLQKINKRVRTDVTKIKIDLKIVSIESGHRVFYFNGLSCTYTFPLRRSWVTIYNLSPFSNITDTYCGLMFKKEANSSRSICLVYAPLNNSQYNEWKMHVSTANFDLQSKYFIYGLEWNDPRARVLHAWCATPEVGFVTLIFHRVNQTNEQRDMFMLTIADYEGSNNTLLEVWKKRRAAEEDKDDERKGPKDTSSRRLSSLTSLGLTLVVTHIVSLDFNTLLA